MSHVSLNRVSFRGTELLMKIDSHGNSTFRESLLKFITRAIKLSFVHYSLSNPIKSLCKFFCFIILRVPLGSYVKRANDFVICRFHFADSIIDARCSGKEIGRSGNEIQLHAYLTVYSTWHSVAELLNEPVVRGKAYHLSLLQNHRFD